MYKPQIDQINLDNRVQNYLDAQCENIKLVNISLNQLQSPDPEELQLQNNFPCLKCNNLPIAPVQQCQDCDGLYCDFCYNQIIDSELKDEDAEEKAPKPAKVCLNPKCKSETLRGQPIGRILRNVMSCFTFKHQEKEFSYEALIKQQIETEAKLKCPVEGCDNCELFTKAQLKDHLVTKCIKIAVKCHYCETEFVRENLENQELHNCAKILNEKLTQTREQHKKTQEQLKSAETQIEIKTKKVEDLEKQNKEQEKKIQELEEKVKAQQEIEKELKQIYNAKRLAEVQIDEMGEIETMISYNLAGANIECSYVIPNGGGTGRISPKELLNPAKEAWSKWYAIQGCPTGPYAWVHIKFPRALLLNGFGITSANDVPGRDPKSFRLFAKTVRKEGKDPIVPDLATDYEKQLLEGFELMKTVADEKFEKRYQNKRYLFDGEDNSNVVATEVKFLIDTTIAVGGVQFCEFEALF